MKWSHSKIFIVFSLFLSSCAAQVDHNTAADMITEIPDGASTQDVEFSIKSKMSSINTKILNSNKENFGVICGEKGASCQTRSSGKCYDLSSQISLGSFKLIKKYHDQEMECSIVLKSVSYNSAIYSTKNYITLTLDFKSDPLITNNDSEYTSQNGSGIYVHASPSGSKIEFSFSESTSSSDNKISNNDFNPLLKTVSPQIVRLAKADLTTYKVTDKNNETHYSVMLTKDAPKSYQDCLMVRLDEYDVTKLYDGSALPTDLASANQTFLQSSGELKSGDLINIVNCNSIIGLEGGWGDTIRPDRRYYEHNYMVVFANYDGGGGHKRVRSYQYNIIRKNFEM